jgi:cytolysin-activating lysine-acyltransferase
MDDQTMTATMATAEDATGGSAPADGADATAAKAALEARVRQVGQRVAIAYGEIVAILARSPKYRHLTLADLEWLVLPPLLTNQFRIATTKMKGPPDLPAPVGVALWAYVSPEVAAKLELQQKDGAMFRLAPQEWKSGDIPWLLDIVAPAEMAKVMYEQLKETVFTSEQPRGLALSG